jgi:HD domain
MYRELHLQAATIAEELLNPESPLEQKLLTIAEFRTGLFYGTPRFGHPEGKVLYHVRDVLDNINKLPPHMQQHREQLRAIAYVHDTFKYQESAGRHPQDWNTHHAVLARRFMENHTADTSMLNIIQWHDEAYYCWRQSEIYRNPSDAEERFENLKAKIGNHLTRYYLFFLCDTRIDGKNQAPVKWVEERLPYIEPIKI